MPARNVLLEEVGLNYAELPPNASMHEVSLPLIRLCYGFGMALVCCKGEGYFVTGIVKSI